ncbi:hypothetical protein [Streptomyces thermolilacinus]|uniref:Uncharacterized protein n=1 Tax=Streptomyces thermolilacinus SPC6 TaxID=1306406 RepID=A0A1D3DU46_9ACTN|nr:hypothetical protein [Streptomyces thermolilacinus]OEJ95845.1 hypothetical protein J116_016550 [Streptomyces thermolilacinus SPC6]
MARAGFRPGAREVAGGYVAVVAALSVAYGAAGAPEGWGAPLVLVSFPGAVVVAVLALLSAALAGGGVDLSGDDRVGLLDFVPQYVGGAVVNVLLVWAVVAFARHFAREARRSRERAGGASRPPGGPSVP